MIVTSPKLHHDWREDWAGAHMRRVGNNWRITLHMRYKKKARGEVLECMVLHGTVNLVPPTPLYQLPHISILEDNNHKRDCWVGVNVIYCPQIFFFA